MAYEEAVTMARLESFDARPLRQGIRTRYLCPLSNMCAGKPRDNAHRSLCVENSSGFFFCHRCGEKGKLREFWEKNPEPKPKIKRANFRPIALDVIKAIKPAAQNSAEKKADLEILRERMRAFAAGFANSPAQNYLEQRGIPKDISSMALCGFAREWEHWEKNRDNEWKLSGTDRRVVFPVLDEERNLVAFHGRAIDEAHINSAKLTKGNKSSGVFYSSPDVFLSPVIAVCEGPADALALQACGVPAVAMIGTSAPAWLAEKLRDKAVLLATDADKAGDEAAMKLRFALKKHTKNIYRLRPLNGKDWAEELELSGAKKLSKYLHPFSPQTGDATRVNSAWEFAQQGFYDEAEFISRLVKDAELRDSFSVLIHREHLKAA